MWGQCKAGKRFISCLFCSTNSDWGQVRGRENNLCKIWIVNAVNYTMRLIYIYPFGMHLQSLPHVKCQGRRPPKVLLICFSSNKYNKLFKFVVRPLVWSDLYVRYKSLCHSPRRPKGQTERGHQFIERWNFIDAVSENFRKSFSFFVWPQHCCRGVFLIVWRWANKAIIKPPIKYGVWTWPDHRHEIVTMLHLIALIV